MFFMEYRIFTDFHKKSGNILCSIKKHSLEFVVVCLSTKDEPDYRKRQFSKQMSKYASLKCRFQELRLFCIFVRSELTKEMAENIIIKYTEV